MKYTPNKIKEFVSGNYIKAERTKDHENKEKPVVQRVILKKIVNATIDSGCRVVWLNSY